MINIIKASLYKLIHDWTFRIVLIVSTALAVFLSLLFLAIDMGLKNQMSDPSDYVNCFANGQNLLFNSLSPIQNFGFAVPIYLVILTIGEFNYGTIRNKIIAGNKKSHIYLCLLLSGLIFTFVIMSWYVLLSFGLGSLMGGFKATGETTYGVLIGSALGRYVLISIMAYIFVTCFSIFVATLIRNIGGSLPIVIVVMLFLFIFGMVSKLTTVKIGHDAEGIPYTYYTYNATKWFNPMYTFGALTTSYDGIEIDNDTFLAGLITPAYWSVIFTFFGTLIFSKRDVK